MNCRRIFLAKIRNRASLAMVSRARTASRREKEQEKIFLAWGSAQPIEKAQSRQGNPRKSKPFPLGEYGDTCINCIFEARGSAAAAT
jgi:hypothetical protein